MKKSLWGNSITTVIFVMAVALTPSFAFAHHVAAEGSGYAHGLAHPLRGLDHLVAMIAIGIWSAQRGGAALRVLPATFVTCLAIGGVIGAVGLPLAINETGILASVVVLGLLIAGAARLPLQIGALGVGFFGLCHGFAHGAELPATVSGIGCGIGFVLTSLGLIGTGAAVVGLSRRHIGTFAIRYAGVAITSFGILCTF